MGKKLRIVFLSKYQNKVSRGVETYVEELSKRLAKEHYVSILSGDDSYSLGKLVKGKYNLVIPTNGRLQTLKASIGRSLGGYKIIISGQAGIGRDDIWNIFITMPDVYVALTEHEAKWAKKWAFKTKITQITNGVDLKKFNSAGSKKNLQLKGPIILSVGALEWYKHHERSIKALAKLDVGSLLIIGQGSEKESLESLGNKLLGKDRFLILKADYDEVADYYRAVNLFVLPSWGRESFGIVYLEAMASGVPVVAPDDQSRKEIVGNGGILVDVSNEEKYALAIQEALSKKWHKLPRTQAEKFSWDIVAEKYMSLFDSMF